MRRLFLALLLLVATAAQAAEPSLAPGARVRVTLLERKSEPIVGTLLALPPGSIAIEDSLARTFPRADVARLEVSGGMKPQTAKYTLIGGIVGAVSATTFGYIVGADVNNQNSGVALGGGFGLAGFLFGAGFGAIVGGTTKSERWEEVKLP